MPNEKKNIHYFTTLYCFNTIISQNHLVNFSRYFFDAEQIDRFAVSIIHLVFSNHGVIPVAFAQLEQARNFLECETSCACSYSDSISITHSKVRGREGGAEEPSIRGWTGTCVPAYVISSVFRVYTNAIHICAETGFHRLASAHIGITLSLT